MLFFRRTCREVTTLLVAREDRNLGWGDRIALQIHLVICEACPRFASQMLGVRHGFQRWRHYVDDENVPVVDVKATKKN